LRRHDRDRRLDDHRRRLRDQSHLNAPLTVKITGGTGRYRHAHGTIIHKSVGNNKSELTIKVS
jgi:hypothetical protein